MSARAAVGQREVLLAQVQEVLEQLNHVEDALDHPRLDARLRERIAVRFKVLLGQSRNSVLQLRDGLRGDASLEQGWLDLHEIRSESAPLFAECLALVEGGLVRAIKLDRGLCRVADALLEELSRLTEGNWERFTVLDEGEYFNDLAAVIRLRFPDVSVWSLPVAAHEFGHYLGGTFEDSRDVELSSAFVRARAAGDATHAILHEQFADCFATYALGPAYPCMCVLQRFDPRTAGVAGDLHPDAASRVALCLDVLTRMDRDAGMLSPFSYIIRALGDTWDEMVLAATGERPALTDDARARLEAAGRRHWELLEHSVPQVRYRGWLRAAQIEQTLLEQHEAGAALAADAEDVRDVLNAAWAARLGGPPGIAPALADWAWDACQAHLPPEPEPAPAAGGGQ
jgi:hypothetical protein